MIPFPSHSIAEGVAGMSLFTTSRLFWLIAAPSHFLALMTITAAILLTMKFDCIGRYKFNRVVRDRFDRIGRYLVIASAVLFVVIGILPTGIWLARPLEDQFTRPKWPSHIDGVLVLSGGLHTLILDSRDAPATEISEARLVSAYELARRYPNARIVFSGGSGTIGGAGVTEARAAEYIFGQMGLDPKRLALEDQSRNTWENIFLSRKLAKPRRGEIWVLATSAIHMPRAMQIAERLHWKMIPWPTDYLTARKQSLGLFFVPENLLLFDKGFHEWLGLLAYR